MGQFDAAQEDVLGDLVGFGLDHNHLFCGGSDGDEHISTLVLVIAGVDHILAVYIGNLSGRHGAVPRYIGVSGGDEGTQRSNDFDGVVLVVGQGGAGDDYIIAEIVVKEGAHGAVDETAHQNATLGGTALTAEISAGDAAHGVHPLLKVDGEGEVVDAGLGGRGSNNGGEHHGVAVTADALAVAQLGHLTGDDGEGTAADFRLEYMTVGEFLFGYHEKTSCNFDVRHRKFST